MFFISFLIVHNGLSLKNLRNLNLACYREDLEQASEVLQCLKL
jgi:hypothetical protein